MPSQDVWVVGEKTVTISQLNLSASDREALERHLLDLNRIIPKLVVATSKLPFGDNMYSNEPGSKGVTQVRAPCGHEYVFSDPEAFVRPQCDICDAWLMRKVRDNPDMWFSKKVGKRGSLLTGKKDGDEK